jgi:hypothetical protein
MSNFDNCDASEILPLPTLLHCISFRNSIFLLLDEKVAMRSGPWKIGWIINVKNNISCLLLFCDIALDYYFFSVWFVDIIGSWYFNVLELWMECLLDGLLDGYFGLVDHKAVLKGFWCLQPKSIVFECLDILMLFPSWPITVPHKFLLFATVNSSTIQEFVSNFQFHIQKTSNHSKLNLIQFYPTQSIKTAILITIQK